MIANKAWEDIKNRPNRITTSFSEYYIEQGVKVERFNNGEVIIMDTTTFGDSFKKLDPYHQVMFDTYGFRSGQVLVLIGGLERKVKYLERKFPDNESLTEINKNIFELRVEFEEIIHNFAIPKSETGVFSQKK